MLTLKNFYITKWCLNLLRETPNLTHDEGCISSQMSYLPTFRKNILPPSSGSRSKPSEQLAATITPKRRYASTRLQGLTPQKIIIFVVKAVRIWDFTNQYCYRNSCFGDHIVSVKLMDMAMKIKKLISWKSTRLYANKGIIQPLVQNDMRAWWDRKYGIVSIINEMSNTYQHIRHGQFRLHIWKEKVECQCNM